MKIMLLSLVVMVSASFAIAEETKEEKKLGWKHESELGYIVVGGNAESETFSAKQSTTYEWQSDLAKVTSSYLVANATTNGVEETTAENWQHTARYEHIYRTQGISAYLEAGLNKDNFRGIDLGNSYGAGGKYKIMDKEKFKWAGELGFQYLREELDPVAPATEGSTLESNFIRVFTQMDYEYTAKMKVGLWVEYLPDIKSGQEDNYRINFSPYFTAVLSDLFSLKFGYEGQYRNLRAAGKVERLDFRHTTTLIATF